MVHRIQTFFFFVSKTLVTFVIIFVLKWIYHLACYRCRNLHFIFEPYWFSKVYRFESILITWSSFANNQGLKFFQNMSTCTLLQSTKRCRILLFSLHKLHNDHLKLMFKKFKYFFPFNWWEFKEVFTRGWGFTVV